MAEKRSITQKVKGRDGEYMVTITEKKAFIRRLDERVARVVTFYYPAEVNYENIEIIRKYHLDKIVDGICTTI